MRAFPLKMCHEIMSSVAITLRRRTRQNSNNITLIQSATTTATRKFIMNKSSVARSNRPNSHADSMLARAIHQTPRLADHAPRRVASYFRHHLRSQSYHPAPYAAMRARAPLPRT